MNRDVSSALIGALPAAVAAGVASFAGYTPLTVLAAAGLIGALSSLFTVVRSPDSGIMPTPDGEPMPAAREIPDLTFAESMPTALLVVGIRGTIRYANAAAREMNARFVPGVHYTTLFRAPVFVDAVAATITDGEARHVRFSVLGQDRHMEASVATLPMKTPSSTAPVYIVLVDRTKDRRAAQMRSDFIANASHELRTPLASILGYIETLQGHAKDDPAAQEEFLGIMSKQARRMQRLVDDLMHLSQIELNEHVRPEEEVDLADIVRDAVNGLTLLAEDGGVTLTLEPLEPAMIRADRDQISQVVINLVENALKYAGKGASVTVGTAPPDPRYARMIGISVADTGPGIAREHIHRLTERFYRVNAAHSRNKGGTGLGLAIVKHILNRHGGALAIESRQGHGSRFSAYLPRVTKGDDSLG
ncbi:sensor histidine kinase [Paracoccaceae bacterium GXU_MW_L88]